MSKESASQFAQTVMNDEELRNRTARIEPAEVVVIAKGMGYEFTADELAAVMNEKELEPEELESVTQ